MTDMFTFDMQVGEHLAALRKASGWTQVELADRLSAAGLSWQQQTLLQVEHGRRPMKLSEAVTVATVLGVSLSELVSSDEAEAAARAAEEKAEREQLRQQAEALIAQLTALAAEDEK